MGQPAPRPPRRDLWMPCCDGIRLASRVWCPAGLGPWPLLLMRQPYGRAIASTVTYAHPRWYAERGFLVVVQDVRGRGDSEGRFGGFAQEAADTAAAVRWCRGLEGCDGRVGSYGFSYQGLSQLLNAGATPADAGQDGDPLPDALAPAMCGVDERLHWASEGGAHWWSLGLGWGLQLAAEGCRRLGDHEGWRRIRRSLESGLYLEEGLELLRRHDPDGMGLEWLRRDPADPDGWRVHHPPEALLRRPLLLIGGWHDPHLLGVLDLFARSREAGGRPRLCVGAWTHLDWRGGIDELQLAFFREHLGADRPEPALSGSGAGSRGAIEPMAFEPAAERAQAAGPHRPLWFAGSTLPSGTAAPGAPDSEWPCLTNPDGAEPAGPAPPMALSEPLLLQVLRSGQWWHQADADPQGGRGWQLAGDGLATIRADAGLLLPCPSPAESSQPVEALPSSQDQTARSGLTLVHDPWRPVPSRGGHLGPEPGLVNRADLDDRGDVACFQTAPLQRPLRLCGRPMLRLEAAADQPGFDLLACLSLLQADGRVLQLSTGVRRVVGERALEQRGVELELQPLAVVLDAGERLRLSLAGAAWPAFAVNPGDGTMPRGGSGPDHRVISLDLDLQQSRLWLEPLIGAN